MLLSVTASQFNTLQPGLELDFETVGPGQTESYITSQTDVYKFVGAATFNSQSATKIDLTDTVISSPPDSATTTQVASVSIYSAFTTDGLVNYGQTGTDGAQSISTTNNPFAIAFPATIGAGQPFTNTYTSVANATAADGSTSTVTQTLSNTYTVPSETLKPITVPAGTFNCLEVDQTFTVTHDASTNTSYSTAYYAQGIGAIETVSNPGTSDETTQELTKENASTRLAFSVPPSNAAAGAVQIPAVQVEIDDPSGNVVSTDNSSLITLTPLGATAGNPITGNTATVVNGIATFSTLSFSTPGVYTLQATDSHNDTGATSNPFTIGGSLTLSITSKIAHPAKGAATGDHIFYELQVTGKKTVQSVVITDTLPAGFTAINANFGGTPQGNTIVWNTTSRVVDFEVIVPSAKVLSGLTKILTSAVANATYTDASTDTAAATNTVKLASSFKVQGILHDVQFQYPAKLTLVTRALLGGVTANLLDNTGAIVGTAKTKGNGTFSVGAPAAGTYTLEFVSQVPIYSTASNKVAMQSEYSGESVTIPVGNTIPVDVGDLYLPKTFFPTASKILNNLNNYTVNGFQGIAKIDLMQFNTSGAESVIAGLAGTAASPGPLMNVAAINAGASPDPWVGAIRMMAGLSVIDTRFADTKALADQTGKVLAVVVSSGFAKYVDQTLGKSFSILQSKNPTSALLKNYGPNGLQQSRNSIDRIAAFTLFGSLLPPALDLLGFSGANKNLLLSAFFNVSRYVSALFSGKLIGDLGFEAVFTLVRIAWDAAILEAVTGASVRGDVGAPYNVVGTIANGVSQKLGASLNVMQNAINTCVANNLLYNTGTYTDQVLGALDKFDGQEHSGFLPYVQYGVSVINSFSSLIKGSDGIIGIEDGKINRLNAGAVGPLLPRSNFQTTLQDTFLRPFNNVVTRLEQQSGKLVGKTLAPELLATAFATAGLGLFDQAAASSFVPNLAANSVLSGTSSVQSRSLPTAASLNADVAALSASQQTTSQSVAPAAKAAPATLSPDATAYLADLTQLSALVKANEIAGVTALYPTYLSDGQALFSNDLVTLDNQAASVLSQLGAAQTTAGILDTDVNVAVHTDLILQLQLLAWGANPATGDPRAVASQITATVAAVTAAATEAPAVKAAVAGQSLPVTLEITEATVPTEISVGASQAFVFTVTNIGSQPSMQGTIGFDNSDGSLFLQGPATQLLDVLAPGASATYTFQVLAIAPTDANFGSSFQVSAAAGTAANTINDEVSVTSG